MVPVRIGEVTGGAAPLPLLRVPHGIGSGAARGRQHLVDLLGRRHVVREGHRWHSVAVDDAPDLGLEVLAIPEAEHHVLADADHQHVPRHVHLLGPTEPVDVEGAAARDIAHREAHEADPLVHAAHSPTAHRQRLARDTAAPRPDPGYRSHGPDTDLRRSRMPVPAGVTGRERAEIRPDPQGREKSMTPVLRRPLALLLATVTALAAALVAIDVSQPSSAKSSQAPTAVSRVVAHNGSGRMRSRIVGHTSKGDLVTGSFVPLKFVKRGGHLKVRGLVQGVVHKSTGTSTFAAMRTIRVKSINGRSASHLTSGRLAAADRTCGVLNLVLGPLDLDLLGLQVHLNRVVLNIVAVTGAGNLLGNLLCAVTGLLDGGLSGLLGQVRSLLNQILGVLNLGA